MGSEKQLIWPSPKFGLDLLTMKPSQSYQHTLVTSWSQLLCSDPQDKGASQNLIFYLVKNLLCDLISCVGYWTLSLVGTTMQVFNSGGAHISDAHCIGIVCGSCVSLRWLIDTDEAGCMYFPLAMERGWCASWIFSKDRDISSEKNMTSWSRSVEFFGSLLHLESVIDLISKLHLRRHYLVFKRYDFYFMLLFFWIVCTWAEWA